MIDSTQAGRTAAEVVPFCLHPVPIVATLREAIDRGATALLIGVAPTGGKLDPAWRRRCSRRSPRACDLEAGLHTAALGGPGAAPRRRRAPAWRCATCARRPPT